MVAKTAHIRKIGIMKMLLKLEETGLLLLGIYLYSLSDIGWWVFILLFFAPDVGMIGYLVNAKTGAFVYNVLHHKGVASVVIAAGMVTTEPLLTATGAILFSHAAFDRIFGFGLKYSDSFAHTHLGWIGRNQK